MKILITSGGTKIPIDLVRSITNMSRGTFGSKICDAFWHMTPVNAEITFLYAKDSRMPELFQTVGPAIKPVRKIEYKTFEDYKIAIEKLLSDEKFDIIVCAAAVSDYGVKEVFDGKYRSTEDEMTIRLVKLPKVITKIRSLNPDAVLCGFKLLVNSTEDELRAAMQKQFDENGLDLCIGNDLRDIKADDHTLTIQVAKKYEPNVQRGTMTYRKSDMPSGKTLADVVVEACLACWEDKHMNRRDE